MRIEIVLSNSACKVYFKENKNSKQTKWQHERREKMQNKMNTHSECVYGLHKKVLAVKIF